MALELHSIHRSLVRKGRCGCPGPARKIQFYGEGSGRQKGSDIAYTLACQERQAEMGRATVSLTLGICAGQLFLVGVHEKVSGSIQKSRVPLESLYRTP